MVLFKSTGVANLIVIGSLIQHRKIQMEKETDKNKKFGRPAYVFPDVDLNDVSVRSN